MHSDYLAFTQAECNVFLSFLNNVANFLSVRTRLAYIVSLTKNELLEIQFPRNIRNPIIHSSREVFIIVLLY